MGEFEILGQRLKELRKKLNMNQKEFSKHIGISTASLSAYETGVKNPSIGVFKSIALKCNVSIDWLCGLEEKKTEITTYKELLELLILLNSCKGLWTYMISEEVDNFALYDDDDLKSGSESAFFDDRNIATGIGFTDPRVKGFFREWEKIKSLKDSSTIDDELYNLWVEKTLSSTSYTDTINEIKPFCSIEECREEKS